MKTTACGLIATLFPSGRENWTSFMKSSFVPRKQRRDAHNAGAAAIGTISFVNGSTQCFMAEVSGNRHKINYCPN
jgi:hypothetical protein